MIFFESHTETQKWNVALIIRNLYVLRIIWTLQLFEGSVWVPERHVRHLGTILQYLLYMY